MIKVNYDENYDIETARLYSYFSDGYQSGLKRFKEVANDNPEYFEIDSLKNINLVINEMLKPSEDHNDEDLEDNTDEVAKDKKSITKDELLKQEREMFELSKDGLISEFNLDYVAGFRDGYGYGKDHVKSLLKDIATYSSLARTINAVKSEMEKIESVEKENAKLDNINKDVNLENAEPKLLEEYNKALAIHNRNKSELAAQKNGYFDLIKKIKELGVTDRFISAIYECNNSVNDFEISANEAIKIINNYKTTVDDVELSIKELKSMYGDYIDLGRDEEEKISNEITNQIYEEIDKIKEYVQDELIKIYNSRANINKIISKNKYQGEDQENKSGIVTESETSCIKEEEDITFLEREQGIIDDLHHIEEHLSEKSKNKFMNAIDVCMLGKAKKLIENLYELKIKDEKILLNRIKNNEIDTDEVDKLDIIYDYDEFTEIYESPLQNKISDVMTYFDAINFLYNAILEFKKGRLIGNGEITENKTFKLIEDLLLSWSLSLYALNYEFMKFANLINTGKSEFMITLD